MNVKLIPKEPLIMEGRKVLYVICEASKEDMQIKNDRLKQSSNHGRVMVQCIETKKVFNSMKEASACYLISGSQVSYACKNPHRTAGGYHWKKIKEKK